MLEADIESKVRKYAIRKGWMVRKFTSPAKKNVPDRIYTAPGGIITYIEFKATGKRPTFGQYRELDKLIAQGCRAIWINDVHAGFRYVDLVHANHNCDAWVKSNWDTNKWLDHEVR